MTTMPVCTTYLDDAMRPAWDAYVQRHPESTLFHKLLWQDAVAESFGHIGRNLLAWRQGRLVGVFPLMEVSSRLAGRLLVSMPYAVYGGVLADDAEAASALRYEAEQLARRRRVQWLDIRSLEPHWPDLPVITRYVTFRKPLPDDPAAVLGDMPRKARAAARQARDKYQLEATFNDDLLPEVWALYSRSMRRLASPNYPRRFFAALLERTDGPTGGVAEQPGHLVQVVRHQGRPIAGLISFIHRGVLMPYFAGCDDTCEAMHPNNFLYLSAMEEGARRGCRTFDFGRSRVDNPGAYNFKRFQGFEPTPLHYQYFIPPGGKEPNLHPGNKRLDVARRLWPRLPLALTRPLGSWLARSIPG